MKNNPLVSVVLPVYNAQDYLEEAIQSILDQTYQVFEFIIIDDGSTDGSLEIIKSFNDERIILISRKNKGLIISLNEGIERAKGNYIARMDADDISLPHRFEEQVNLMEKDRLDICGSHFFIINQLNDYVGCSIVPIEEKNFLNYLAVTPPFAHPSVMIRKAFMQEKNLFYGATQSKYAEDYALWIDFWNHNARFGNVNKFLFKYREFATSLSKKNRKEIIKDRQKISKKIILQNKESLAAYYSEIDIMILSKREQELIAMTLMILLKYDFSLKYIKFFKKINKRVILFSVINFFRIGY